jgi:hypothetical protein
MIGIYQDEFPRGRVAMRGWDPQNPTKQTIALPVVDKTNPEKPEWIWPGHVLFPTADGKMWTKTPTGTPTVIAVAQDASVDTHVLAANSLVGLACSDSFKLATPFFRKNTGDNYTIGTALTYCKATDTVESSGGKAGDAVGYIKPAAKGDVVIGYVCETPAVADTQNHNAWNLQPDFVNAVDSMSKKKNAFFVIWNTCYQVQGPTA